MSKYCLSSIKNTCNKCSKLRRVFAWRAFIACYKLFVAVAACAAALTLAEALALSHTQSRTHSLTQSLTHTFGSLALSLALRLSRRSRRRTRARAGAGAGASALFALQQCRVESWPQFVFDDRCVWWCRACAVCKRPLSFLSKLFGQLRDICERLP